MVQQTTDQSWQAEARSEETRQFIKNIKRLTRRKFTAEEKVRIVLEGFRRDTPIRDLCRREGIQPSTYYAWLKDFMEAGKDRLDVERGNNIRYCSVRRASSYRYRLSIANRGLNQQLGSVAIMSPVSS